MMTRLTRIDGGCHCGNIRYILHWPSSVPVIPVRECGCRFCLKHGGAWTSHTGSTVEVTIKNRSGVSEYRFGTATADFQVCACCGVVPLVTCEIDDNLYAVVNTNSFEDFERLTFSRATANFDGEGIGDRLARRKQNWIPEVRICEGGN